MGPNVSFLKLSLRFRGSTEFLSGILIKGRIFFSCLLISLSQKQVKYIKHLKIFREDPINLKILSVVYLLARFSNNLIQTGRESLRQRIEMKVGLFL